MTQQTNSKVVGTVDPAKLALFRAQQSQLDSRLKALGLQVVDLVHNGAITRSIMEGHARLLAEVAASAGIDPNTTPWSIDGEGRIVVPQKDTPPDVPEE